MKNFGDFYKASSYKTISLKVIQHPRRFKLGIFPNPFLGELPLNDQKSKWKNGLTEELQESIDYVFNQRFLDERNMPND